MASSGHASNPLSAFSQYAGLGSFAGSGLPSSTVQATIALDQPGNEAYTNLDIISGRVLVRCAKPADVSSIVVKLEGESRTRLMSPGNERERPRPVMEYHKILYNIQTVFPPPEVLEGRPFAPGKASYTLPIGQHEYRFSFKLPFNNTCSSSNKNQQAIGGFEVMRPPSFHVKKTLPPTLNGFPGEAEIRYFVKATVNRHSVFKENPRAFVPFNFLPIEPPRLPMSGSEIFGRQRHSFTAIPGSGLPMKGKMKGMFGKSGSPVAAPPPPSFSVDARLPEPAILTCNNDVPLRLLVNRLNESTDSIILDSLQVSLIGHTKIRAHEVFRTESTSWIIISKSNLRTPISIDSPSDASSSETILDDRLWRGHPLPHTIAPSFVACNIERYYQLDIRIGLSYTSGDGTKPQNIILPIRLDTLVYSGIALPPEVLAQMREAQSKGRRASGGRRRSTNPHIPGKLQTEGRYDSEFGSNQIPITPIDAPNAGPAFPPRPGAHGPSGLPAYEEAPPSYEDAIASSVPPVSAPRPRYEPPPQQEDRLLGGDEKKGFTG